MATQYSNKPIVTDGLVYALDFGNPKSYTSGSNSAFNLKYSPITSSVYPNNTFNSTLGLLNITSSAGVLTPALSAITHTGEFTIAIVASADSSINNSYLLYNGLNPRTAFPYGSKNSNTGAGIIFGGVLSNKGRSYSSLNYTQLQHLTWRYSSGSYTFFVNGIPQPPISFGQIFAYSQPSFQIGRGNYANYSGSVGTVQVYNRALSSNEIWSNLQLANNRYKLTSQITKPYTIDENAYLFLSQSGITDPIITSSINTFVLGLKSASLWDKMIAIYPFVGTGSAGVNLTSSQAWNLKEPSTAIFHNTYNGSWQGSTSGSTPSGSGTYISVSNFTPANFGYNPFFSTSSAHISILSYDTPVSSSYLMGTGMTEDLAISTLAGDYGTPAAAYSVRKVRTAYSGALMDVRRSIDNVTSSIGYVSNGDLDIGSLLDWVVPGRSTLPGAYSGLAAAYSLRRVSSSYTGFAIDIRRDSDNTTSSIGFNDAGNLDTGTLLAFVTGSANTGSGFVAQWYDQSGNGRHATQTATGSQPLIVSSGSLITENGKPAIRFDGAGDQLVAPLVSTSTEATFTAVHKSYTTAQGGIFTNGYSFGYGLLAGTKYDLVALNVAFNPSTENVLTNTQSLAFAYVKPSTTRQLYVNNTQYTIATSSSINTPNTSTTIGSWDQSGQHYNGTIQELTIYDGNLTGSRTLIENNINNYYNIYTGSNHGFVARWYDQSGNNRHASQTTAGSQPLIVESGSVILEPTSSKPALRFDGVNDDMTTPSIPLSQPTWTFTTFYNVNTSSRQRMYIGSGFNFDINAATYTIWGGSSGITGTRTLGYNLLSNLHNGNSSEMYENTRLIASGIAQTGPSAGALRIGSFIGVGDFLTGSLQELVIHNSNQSANRAAIDYGINDYYNIYPQTSSFATSSFTIKADSGSISASLNNRLTSGIAASGPLGLITVSRTGSNSLTIARNGVTSSFAVPASGALSTGLYLGAINNNGIAVGSSPLNISFASVGTGLTNSETLTLGNLVGKLQYNLRRFTPTSDGLVLNLDAGNPLSYPGSGSTWYNTVSNTGHATLTGTTFTTVNDGAFYFAGNNNYGIGTISAGNQFTYSVWVRPTTSTGERHLLEYTANQFWIGFDNRLGTSIWSNAAGATAIQSGRWYNIILTRSTTNINLYLNGVLDGTTTNIGANPFDSTYYIGRYFGSATNYNFVGDMSIVQIYNKALSESEIIQNFNATRGRFGV